jgi:WD40 repeat protein
MLATCATLFAGWLILGPRWTPRLVVRSEKNVFPLALSADGRLFATVGTDGITLCDGMTGRSRAVWQLPEGRSAMMGAFSIDGRTFAALSSRGYPRAVVIDLIDVASGRIKASVPTVHSSMLHIDFAAVDREVRAVVCTQDSRTGEVIDIDAETGEVRSRRAFTPPKAGSPEAVSANGKFLVASTFGGSNVFVRDIETDREVAKLAITTADGVSSLGISPDGTIVAVGVSGGVVELWDVASRKVKARLPLHRPGYEPFGSRFSSDGSTLASRGEYHKPVTTMGSLGLMVRRFLPRPYRRPAPNVVVADLATGRVLGIVEGAAHPYFSADGRTLATMNIDFSARLFDIPAPAPAKR